MAPMFFRGLKGGISCASPSSLATCSTVDYRHAAAPGQRKERRSYERPSDPAPAPYLKDSHRSKSVNSTSLYPASKPTTNARGKLRKPPPPPPPPPLASPGSSTRYLLNGGGGDDDDGYSYFDTLDGYLEPDLSPSLIPVIDSSRFRLADKGDEFSRSLSTPALRPSQWPRPREERREAFRSAYASAPISGSSSSTSTSSNSDITIGATSVAGRYSSAGTEGTWVRFQTVNTGEESAVLQPSSFRKSSASVQEDQLAGIRGAPPLGGLALARPSPSGSDSVAVKQLVTSPGDSTGTPSAVSLERHQVDKAAEVGGPAALKLSSSSGLGDQVMTLRVSIHCKGCEAKVRKHLSRMQGVKSFKIEFAAKKVTVVGNVTPLALLSSISKVKNAQFWPEPPLSTI